ncbi:MAG: hypothetical protein DRG78_08460 [Epsilonproteobacteria bacterium]|nr:MAG: hypothetical protein DRG78_08460 [Campylobacterota bacterium]
MVADTLHQDMYVYDIYAEYLNKIEHYALNSSINSLSIRYYKQNFPLTKGIHNELDVVVTSMYGRTYDIFDFTPVLESTPLTYSTTNDETNQGVIRKTEGTMTIMAVLEPLPGDVLNFYQHGSTNEFFSVNEVNFVHSVKDLNIYQITFSTSNWTLKSIEDMNISEHYYYMKEFKKFYSSELYEDYSDLLNNRNDVMEVINKYYDCAAPDYNNNLSDTLKNKVNSTLLYLNEKVNLQNKIILDHEILYDSSGLVQEITEEETYIAIPDYIPEPYDPNIPYDPYVGKSSDELLTSVRYLQDKYYKFINYQTPIDGNQDTTGITDLTVENKTFKEDAIHIIKDLDGNIIN